MYSACSLLDDKDNRGGGSGGKSWPTSTATSTVLGFSKVLGELEENKSMWVKIVHLASASLILIG